METIALLFAGILAGLEFIVRYGVQPALRTLPDEAHILARVALVRRLRVVVPAVMLPTVVAGVAVTIADGGAFRWAGTAALVAFLLFSFLGTVPINIKVIEWRAADPPADWPATVRRWERIDVFRSSAAILAFGCFLIALVRQI